MRMIVVFERFLDSLYFQYWYLWQIGHVCYQLMEVGRAGVEVDLFCVILRVPRFNHL